jgi:hypothetical protein
MTQLITELNALRATTDQQASAFAERIVAKGMGPLLQGVSTLAEALPLPSDGPLPLEQVRQLRSVLEGHFLPAYARMLGGSNLPLGLGEAFRNWMQDMARSVTDCSEAIQDDEPAGLYLASDADGWWTATRKAAVRLGRTVRKPDGTPIRQVPMRDLALALQREWLPLQFGRIIDDDRKRIARYLARLESAVSVLVHAVLERESRLLLSQSDGADEEDLQHLEKPTVADALKQVVSVLEEAPKELRSEAANARAQFVEQAWIRLQREADRAGSFQSAIPTISDEGFERRLDRIEDGAGRWAVWQNQLNQRADFFRAVIALRSAFDVSMRGASEGLEVRLLRPVQMWTEQASGSLAVTLDSVQALFSQREDGNLFATDTAHLQQFGDKAAQELTDGLVTPVQDLSLMTRIADEHSAFLEALQALKGELPEAFHLHPLQADAVPDPDADTREVSFRDIVQNGIAEITRDRLAERSTVARDTFREALEELGDLTSIVRFSFQSALETSQSGAMQPGQQEEMVIGGLRRTHDAVLAIQRRIEDGSAHLADVYRMEVLRAWLRIQDRLRVEHQMGAYVLDMRSRLDAEAREAGKRLFRWGRQARFWTEKLLRRGHREAKALIERGREAVGSPSQTRASFYDTAMGLAELDSVMERVPPVYRKLFSFQPLTDPDLLVGRAPSRTFIEQHLQQFSLGMPQAALLVGGPSTGRTSLLNVLSARELQGHDVRMLRFTERPASARQLLARMRESLALDLPEADTLPEAARLWMARDVQAGAPVCLVENMELLMLRGIGGYTLLVDLLQFMSLTDSRIIWIGTLSSYAWQILNTAYPDTVGLVNSHTLSDLGRDDLERLIMERHRKSGVPITFEEPTDMSPLLKRKLRRARSKDRRQALLREAFFDRLHAQFGQNIQMALLQWIRSITMSEEGKRMHVAPTPPLNLSFFSGFNLDQAFALKALLEHGMLSPEAYADVDRLPRDRALMLFETLGNALIIEAVGRADSDTMNRHTAVHVDQPYRIRPLFTHAVVRLLRERNIVH